MNKALVATLAFAFIYLFIHFLEKVTAATMKG